MKGIEKIKQIVWNVLPYNTEILIHESLSQSFRKIRCRRNGNLKENILRIEKREKKEKIKVVFLCNFPSMWNACSAAFTAALNNHRIEVYLLALPLWDKTGGICRHNDSYAFCKKIYPFTINAFNYANQKWFDIRELNPDYVILSRPYDDELPPKYKSAVLAEYAKICYLPYAYCKMNWDCRQVYRCDFLDNIYAVFTESSMYCQIITRMYYKAFCSGYKKIKNIGYQRFDLINKTIPKELKKFKKIVLWLPRWTNSDLLEASTFFLYKDLLLNFFERHQEYELICRPHPLMFDNFIATGTMTVDEVTDFKKMFSEAENFFLDESADYLLTFSEADIFISDASSLLIEEFVTGKPIIYCGKMNHFDKQAKRWARFMYHCNNEIELFTLLNNLLDGNDPKCSIRKHIVEEIVISDGHCGERVIDFIIEDYFKTTLEERKT